MPSVFSLEQFAPSTTVRSSLITYHVAAGESPSETYSPNFPCRALRLEKRKEKNNIKNNKWNYLHRVTGIGILFGNWDVRSISDRHTCPTSDALGSSCQSKNFVPAWNLSKYASFHFLKKVRLDFELEISPLFHHCLTSILDGNIGLDCLRVITWYSRSLPLSIDSSSWSI